VGVGCQILTLWLSERDLLIEACRTAAAISAFNHANLARIEAAGLASALQEVSRIAAEDAEVMSEVRGPRSRLDCPDDDFCDLMHSSACYGSRAEGSIADAVMIGSRCPPDPHVPQSGGGAEGDSRPRQVQRPRADGEQQEAGRRVLCRPGRLLRYCRYLCLTMFLHLDLELLLRMP
jgi:hypothetical protein